MDRMRTADTAIDRALRDMYARPGGLYGQNAGRYRRTSPSVGERLAADLPPSVGERNSAARMTADKVRALRTAHAAGGKLRYLAAAFGIDVRTARHIVNRTSWTHVD